MKTIRELYDAAGSYGITEYGDAYEKKETAFIQTCLPAYEAW